MLVAGEYSPNESDFHVKKRVVIVGLKWLQPESAFVTRDSNRPNCSSVGC